VDHALSGMEGIGSEYQIVLDRKDDGKDYMTLKVERSQGVGPERDPELSGKIREEIKKQIMVSADVALFEYGSLPRSERKSKRVFDNREMD
jgi:phenylacetate-CoA ligase